MARAATSTSIQPFCQPASAPRTIRSRRRGHLLTRSPMIAVRRRLRTIHAPRREPSNERGSSALQRAAAIAALADGDLYSGYAVYWRWHGVYSDAEVSDARFDP